MRYRSTAFVLSALATGAFADVLVSKKIYYWPVWSGLVFPCAILLCFGAMLMGREYSDQIAPGPAGEVIRSGSVPIARLIVLGMVVTHTVLLVRDLVADPTSHNIWPAEYVFFGSMVAAPAFAGSILVHLIFAIWRWARPE